MESPRNDLIAPQHLDRALYVTTPKAWLGLFMLVVMTAAAVVWAVVGEVASYVHGDGIVLRRGGAAARSSTPWHPTTASSYRSLRPSGIR